MANIDDSLSRMKDLMGYGMVNEGKQHSDISLEHATEGADGKTYGVIREGSNYFIKVAKKAANGKRFLAEDFDFIGGWMNRKNNQYSSYSCALKNFDLKMMSLAEAYNKAGDVITESIDPSKKEDYLVEENENMRHELDRLKSIMKNAQLISEGKCISETKNEFSPVVGGKAECGCATTKAGKNSTQKAISAEGGEKAKVAPKDKKDKLGEAKYVNVKGKWYDKSGQMVNESEVLAWNDNKDYLDTAHGTEIGDSAPFSKKANDGGENHASHSSDEGEEMKDGVEETKSVNEGMEEPTKFDGYRQIDKGLPSQGGMGKVGDSAPYEETVNECDDTLDECDDTAVNEDFDIDDIIDDENPDADAEMAPDSDEISAELNPEDGSENIEIGGDEELGDGAEGEDDEMSILQGIRDIQDRLSKLEGKFSDDEDADFGDDSLYGDDEPDTEAPEDDEQDGGSEGEDVDMSFGDENGDDDVDVHDDKMSESRKAKKNGRKMNEDKLNVYGKHPAYQKKVMTLPTNKHSEKEGYNDWNDESVKGEAPFGQKIGSSAPFTISTEKMANAIAESITNFLKNSKKKI